MGGVRKWVLGALVAGMLGGCAGASKSFKNEPSEALLRASPAKPRGDGSMYQDTRLGFALARPAAEWEIDESEFFAEDGISIPLLLRHSGTGAQVILQIAPDVASPIEYAEQMTAGLSSQPGFRTTDVEPIPLTDASVGFFFAVGEDVMGRVAVREGSPGNVFMMMATWPSGVSEEVIDSIDGIIASIRPLVPTQFAASRVVPRPEASTPTAKAPAAK